MRTGILAAALVVSACHKSEAPAVAPEDPPIKVESAVIAERSIAHTIPVTGTLTADLRTELTANASGRVNKTFVERGQRVTQGTVLAQLDTRASGASLAQAQADVQSARTQLESARTECARYAALVARGAITQQEYDKQTASCSQQLAALNISQAKVTSAAITVGDGTIRAPFAGVVTDRAISVGDYVQASSKVVTLVVSNPLRLKMTVPERRIGELKEGELVTFSPVALPDKVFSGTVKYISGEVREQTRDIIVEAIVANADGALLPGMFVSASLNVGERPAPLVPKTAVFDVGDDKAIYAIKNNRLEQRIVLLGPPAGDDLPIEEGAKTGERVVIKPTAAMYDGQRVE